MLKAKPTDVFSAPVTNASITCEMFARNAIPKNIETDWSIIKSIFEPNAREKSNIETEPNFPDEIEYLRNESEYHVQTRSQSRMSFIAPALVERPNISTYPQRPQSRQSFRCSTPQSPNANIVASQRGVTSILDIFNEEFTPPPEFKNTSSSAPLIDFDNIDQSDFELPNVPEKRQIPPLNGKPENMPEMDRSEHQIVDCPDLLQSLGKHSIEYELMAKLVNLWRTNVYPIKVVNLLQPNSNRFQAAKTFSSLLSRFNSFLLNGSFKFKYF